MDDQSLKLSVISVLWCSEKLYLVNRLSYLLIALNRPSSFFFETKSSIVNLSVVV